MVSGCPWTRFPASIGIGSTTLNYWWVARRTGCAGGRAPGNRAPGAHPREWFGASLWRKTASLQRAPLLRPLPAGSGAPRSTPVFLQQPSRGLSFLRRSGDHRAFEYRAGDRPRRVADSAEEGLSRFLEATSWPDGAKPSVRRLRHYWTETLKVDWDSSFHNLPEDVQTVMLRGKAGESLGLLPLLRKVAEAAPGGALEALNEEHPCPECQGRRLNAQARAVTIRGLGSRTWRT